jgi:zinc-ribbon domain
MRCHSCGHENPAGSRYCSRCGTPFLVGQLDPTAARFDVESQRAYSISNVGRDQFVYQQRSVELGRPSRTGPWTMGAGGLVFLAGLGIWGFAVLGSVFEFFNFLGQASPSEGAVPAFPGFDFHTDLLALGGAIMFVGMAVFFIGVFITVVTWRRRRASR